MRVTHTSGVGSRSVATAGIRNTTHASFLREPGGPVILKLKRRLNLRF